MLPARDQMRYYQYLINVKTIPKVLLRTQFYQRVQSYLANNGADVWVIPEHLGHGREMVGNRYLHMFPEKRNKMKNCSTECFFVV